MGEWIDYRKLRENIDFVQVLENYRVKFKRRGSQAVSMCPLPGHRQDDKRSTPFSVSLEKSIFQCFGCGAKGNVLDFIALMQGCDPRNASEFRKAAEFAQQTFMNPRPARTAIPPRLAKSEAPQEVSTPPPVRSEQSVVTNEPLDFALKNLNPTPKYLLDRGFTQETMSHFGLGYCSRGMLAGRIAIPLHDMQGRLIGYAGRLAFDEAVDDANPKYVFPSRRERNGKILEFSRTLFVYHGHQVRKPVHDLVVVQGFPACWWLWQCGHRDVVALMGDRCSFDQSKAIVNLTAATGRIWFLVDNTKDGERCAEGMFFDVGQQRFCKWVRLKDGQPSDCPPDQLSAMLAWKNI